MIINISDFPLLNAMKYVIDNETSRIEQIKENTMNISPKGELPIVVFPVEETRNRKKQNKETRRDKTAVIKYDNFFIN